MALCGRPYNRSRHPAGLAATVGSLRAAVSAGPADAHPVPPLLTPPPVAVIYIALVIFTFLVYATPNSNVGLGSISKVYDNLARVAQ